MSDKSVWDKLQNIETNLNCIAGVTWEEETAQAARDIRDVHEQASRVDDEIRLLNDKLQNIIDGEVALTEVLDVIKDVSKELEKVKLMVY